jgi:hypothetical protein
MQRILLSLPFLLLPLAPVANANGDDVPNPIPNEERVTRRCEAAIGKATGNFSRCLLKASAKFARNGDANKLAAKQEKCQENFNEDFDEAIEQGPGQCTRLREPIIERTFSYVEEVATEASGEIAAEVFFVQRADDAVLTDSTLTFTGVSLQTGWILDDPYRAAGQITTDAFVSGWYEGNVDADPPTADFSCEVDGELVDIVVELNAPVLAGDDLSYSVDVISDISQPAALECAPSPTLIFSLFPPVLIFPPSLNTLCGQPACVSSSLSIALQIREDHFLFGPGG